MFTSIIRAAAAALATGIIVPLYIYPDIVFGDNCAAWAPLNSALSSHTSLPFYLIINPNSGPGDPGTQPDSTSQACFAALRQSGNTNVKLLGYVRTTYGSRSATDVDADIATYGGWSSAYRPDGIFFDEVSGTTTDFATYTGFANDAKSEFGTAAYIILNPGSMPEDSDYYTIADLLVVREDYYTNFSPSSLTFSSATPASKQAVILHDWNTTQADETSMINTLVGTDHIGALYITDQEEASNPYDAFPSNWATFVDDVQAAET